MSDADLASLLDDDSDPDEWVEMFEALRPRTVAEPLDIRLCEVDDQRIELAMPITDAVRQPFGLLHGGVSMVLAESAASTHACWGIDLTERVPVGLEINGSHLDSARDGEVRAIGRVLKRGGRTIVHEVEIVHETDRSLCRARVTNLYVDPDRTA